MCLVLSCTSCLRVRNRPRSSCVAPSGTKLARIRPWARRSDCQAASLTSLLRPGTFFTCRALASTSSTSPSLRMCQTGFQYTPVASMATCRHPCEASQSESSSSSRVVVPKVRSSRFTLPSTTRRRQATTVSL